MILITSSGVSVSVTDEKAKRLIASGGYVIPTPPKAPVKSPAPKPTTK